VRTESELHSPHSTCRAVVMEMKPLHRKQASSTCSHRGQEGPNRRKAMSNLSVLMNQHQEASVGRRDSSFCRAQSPRRSRFCIGSACAAPSLLLPICFLLLECSIEVDQPHLCAAFYRLSLRFSSGIVGGRVHPPAGVPVSVNVEEVRR
jgi:hypothetical protein